MAYELEARIVGRGLYGHAYGFEGAEDGTSIVQRALSLCRGGVAVDGIDPVDILPLTRSTNVKGTRVGHG